MLAPQFPIRTERLLLRPLDPALDADAVYGYASRPDVCRYIPWQPRTREEIPGWLADGGRTVLEAEGQFLRLAIVVRATGVLVGDVLLFWRSVEHRTGELGYVLHPDHHGHGYATEAAGAMLRLAFDEVDGLVLHRVIARVDARNDASAAVLRRLGMRQEAHLRENEWFKGEWTDELGFALLASEWRERQASA